MQKTKRHFDPSYMPVTIHPCIGKSMPKKFRVIKASKAISAISPSEDVDTYANLEEEFPSLIPSDDKYYANLEEGFPNDLEFNISTPIPEYIGISKFRSGNKQWTKSESETTLPGFVFRGPPLARMRRVDSPCQTTPQRVRIDTNSTSSCFRTEAPSLHSEAPCLTSCFEPDSPLHISGSPTRFPESLYGDPESVYCDPESLRYNTEQPRHNSEQPVYTSESHRRNSDSIRRILGSPLRLFESPIRRTESPVRSSSPGRSSLSPCRTSGLASPECSPLRFLEPPTRYSESHRRNESPRRNTDSLSRNESPRRNADSLSRNESPRRNTDSLSRNESPRRIVEAPRCSLESARCNFESPRRTVKIKCDKSVGVVGRSRIVCSVRCQTSTSVTIGLFQRRPLSINNAESIACQPSFETLSNQLIQCTPVICGQDSVSESCSCNICTKKSCFCQCDAPGGCCASCQSYTADYVSACVQSSRTDVANVACGCVLIAAHCQTSATSLEEEMGGVCDAECECTEESQCPMRCASARQSARRRPLECPECGSEGPASNHDINTAYKYYTHLLFKHLGKLKTNFQKHLQLNNLGLCTRCNNYYAADPSVKGKSSCKVCPELCHRCSASPRPALDTLHRNAGYNASSHDPDSNLNVKQVESFLRSIYSDTTKRTSKEMMEMSKQLVELFNAEPDRHEWTASDATKLTRDIDTVSSCNWTHSLMHVSDGETGSSSSSRTYNKV